MTNLFDINHVSVLSYWLINSQLPSSIDEITQEDILMFESALKEINILSVYSYILTCRLDNISYPAASVILSLRNGYFNFFINHSCELAALPLSQLQYSPKIIFLEDLIYFLENLEKKKLPVI